MCHRLGNTRQFGGVEGLHSELTQINLTVGSVPLAVVNKKSITAEEPEAHSIAEIHSRDCRLSHKPQPILNMSRLLISSLN